MFGTLLQTKRRLPTARFFVLYVFFKNTIKVTSVLVYSYRPVELMEEFLKE